MSAFIRIAMLVCLAFALVAPTDASACSCLSDRRAGVDASPLVNQEVQDADVIFLGHVVKSTGPDAHGNYEHGIAVLRVTEVFKGNIKVGADAPMPAGDASGDCSLIYVPQSDVLVFASFDGDGLTAGHCSRTRTIDLQKPDLELQWLRNKASIFSKPVVLQREHVTCERCTLPIVGAMLVGANYPGCCGAKKAETTNSIATKKPFWTGGYYEHQDPQHSFVEGIAKDGTAFQLVETRDTYPDSACTGRVEKRTCARLESNDLTAKCVSPGSLQPVCDEKKSRKNSPGDLEAIGNTNCRWRRLNDVDCVLPNTVTSLPAAAPLWPRLVCSPRRPESFMEEPSSYICNVLEHPPK